MARLVFLGCIVYLVTGFGQVVLGTVMEPMVHAYGVQYGDGGQLVMNQFLGGMVGIMCAPWLMARIGKKGIILSMLALIAVCEAVYLLQPPWLTMLLVSPLAGLGLGTVEALVGSFVIAAAAGNANKAMSRVEIFFGLGALLMPFVGSLLISLGIWKISFALVSILAAAAWLLWLLFWPSLLDNPVAHGEEERHEAASPMPKAARSRLVLSVCMLFFLVYVGLEMSFIHYLPSLMVQNNHLAESTASLSISLFWATMTIGRMAAGHAADRWGGAAYLVAMCSANAVLFALMVGLDGTTATFLLAAGSGLVMSGMFAIALVFANRTVTGLTERTTSLLIASGGVGGALFPKLTGWCLDQFGAYGTRWLFAILAVVLLSVLVWALLAAKPRRSPVLLVTEGTHG
ncbi:MFS transporter [Cohnella pontilimi]|uniref:MFS transporter n=1 Tax=Cohnella pontilimi TaxID=2564100 RepID=A0A4U0F3P6_9BACL|nr:MFS transporter [Cohnella pontilimi]TJY38950.1 MFS transporter [Cohnella pontilimi]